jgi:hypothetical protein
MLLTMLSVQFIRVCVDAVVAVVLVLLLLFVVVVLLL